MQIDTVVFFFITDPKAYTYGVDNPIFAIEKLTATTLRNIIGEIDLDQTLTSRDLINAKMRDILDEATDPWGIKVNRVELKTFSRRKTSGTRWKNKCARNASGARPSLEPKVKKRQNPASRRDEAIANT